MTKMNIRTAEEAPVRPELTARELIEPVTTPNSHGETRVAHVQLRTADLERALAFYLGVLGFKLVERNGAAASLSPTGRHPSLLTLNEDRAARPRPARTLGLYHSAIRYPTRRDLAHALQRLARHEYPIHGASDHIVSEAIYLSDPDHNGVELYVDRPRTQWVWRNGQVAMATEALDLDDLLSTVQGEQDLVEPPPQTDLGHIHLHVADLGEAERFYQGFLGLAVTQRSYPGALFFAANGYHHHVAANTWAGKASAPENSVGLLSYRLEVPSKEILSSLRSRAAVAGYEANTRWGNRRELLRVRDPNGNWLEIIGPAQSAGGV
jgi:catechol 2,3-dioxygenase